MDRAVQLLCTHPCSEHEHEVNNSSAEAAILASRLCALAVVLWITGPKSPSEASSSGSTMAMLRLPSSSSPFSLCSSSLTVSSRFQSGTHCWPSQPTQLMPLGSSAISYAALAGHRNHGCPIYPQVQRCRGFLPLPPLPLADPGAAPPLPPLGLATSPPARRLAKLLSPQQVRVRPCPCLCP